MLGFSLKKNNKMLACMYKVKPEKFSKVAKEEDKEINNVRDGIKHRKRETGEKIF